MESLTSKHQTNGSGIHGLSQLLIIREVMGRLMAEENMIRKQDGRELLSELPKPCKYFDLISGTSTGGCVDLYICFNHHHTKIIYYRIIALMLGHLQMGIDEAIQDYQSLARKVFSVKNRCGDGKFRAARLEKVIKDVVAKVTGDSESALLEGNESTRVQC